MTAETSITPARAWAIVRRHTGGATLIRHMRSVELAMRAYARRFGEDEDRWAVVGILHDFDYEAAPDQHPVRGQAILREENVPEDVIQDIASHADFLGVPRDSALRKSLYAVDEMCGFIIACALVKPDRSLSTVEPAGVRRKMKDKAFARTVHREELVAGAALLGVDFDEHVAFVRDALIPAAEELGLNP